MTSSSRNEFKLIDDLCDEFEQALKGDSLPSIATYLERAPQGLRSRLLQELCLLEAELLPSDLWSQRKQAHLAAFPADSSVIEAVQPPAAAPTPTGQADQTRADAPATRGTTPVGQLVGAYELVELIGEGGMGSVFRAEQRQPVHREVALKLIRPGLDSREIRARFEAERQALAMMDHPNIARILEAGTTEDGQLYFAMEWVQGDPLVEYCDRKQMPIDKRLALFTQVCEAVQHAHQKGVIHRDLKPSNILVAEFNGQPVPKVIDFGLAKALDASSQLTDRTLQTEFGQVIGTVKYMSPEQAGLNDLDIDTRSDIYSLGVILYELLTGTTPLGEDVIRGRSLLSVLGLLREHEAVKPSSRIAAIRDGQRDSLASQPRVDGRRLTHILTGDLDWIVLKALDRDRERRYETAAAFAADLDRYANRLPVVARPPTWNYVAQKFMAKHRGLVASVAALMALLVLGVAVSSWFALRAVNAERATSRALATAEDNEQAALRSRQQAVDAVDEFFTLVSEEELLNTQGMQPLRTQLLEKATTFYDRITQEDSQVSPLLLVQAKLRYAHLLDLMHRPEEAIAELREAKEMLATDQHAVEQQQTELSIEVLTQLGKLQLEQLQVDEAASTLAEAQSLASALVDEHPTDAHQDALAWVYLGQAQLEVATGDTSKATRVLQDAAAALPADALEAGNERLLRTQAEILSQLGTLTQGEQRIEHLDEAIEVRRRLLALAPESHTYQQRLARTLDDRALRSLRTDSDLALEMLEEAFGIADRLHQQNPDVGDYRRSLARVADGYAFGSHQIGILSPEPRRSSLLDQSLALYQQANRLLGAKDDRDGNWDISEVWEPDLQQVGQVFNGLALVRRDLQEPDASVARFDDAVRVQERLAGLHPDVARHTMDLLGTQMNYSSALAKFGRIPEAIAGCEKAVTGFNDARQRFPEDHSLARWEFKAAVLLHENLYLRCDPETISDHAFDLRPLADELRTGPGVDAMHDQLPEIFEALHQAYRDGDFSPYAELHEEVVKPGHPYAIYIAARGLAKLHQWGTLSGSLSAEDNEIVFAWATELLDVLPARTGQSREQLLAAPLLRYLDQQQTEAVGGE